MVDEYQTIVGRWAESIIRLGIEVKGLWLIDFDVFLKGMNKFFLEIVGRKLLAVEKIWPARQHLRDLVGQPLNALNAFQLGAELLVEHDLLELGQPIFKLGLSALRASAVLTSEVKDGVDVCSTTRSRFVASGAMSWNASRWGGASMSLESGRSAAGCASQVGYQKDWISRRA